MRLDGIRVLDLTRLLPGPYATQLLADAGADVVKVEDTDAGDYARYMPPTTEAGHGAVFDAVNRGKRSVALDLKTDAGREVCYDLARGADVVIESFRPGVAERLGVDYDRLREENDDLVYCSLTGYGQTGPYADRAGHDLNYVGLAGLLDMTREDADARPVVPGYQIADMGGGLFAAFSVVGALLSRELGNTGGEYVDVAMTDVVLSFAQSLLPQALAGENPRPGETALTGGYPWYDVYETADERWITLGALEPQFWAAFCEAVDREDLREEHMVDDPARRRALREELTELFAERTLEEWERTFEDVDATVEGVHTLAEALSHPQTEARGLVERSEDAPPRVGFPARTTERPGGASSVDPDDVGSDGASGGPPGHGEHTERLLRERGYDEVDLEALREEGAIE